MSLQKHGERTGHGWHPLHRQVQPGYAKDETHKARLMRIFPAHAIPTPMNELVDTPTIFDRDQVRTDHLVQSVARDVNGEKGEFKWAGRFLFGHCNVSPVGVPGRLCIKLLEVSFRRRDGK